MIYLLHQIKRYHQKRRAIKVGFISKYKVFNQKKMSDSIYTGYIFYTIFIKRNKILNIINPVIKSKMVHGKEYSQI